MAGVGIRAHRCTPKNVVETTGDANAAAGPPVKGKFKAKERSKKATTGQAAGTHEQDAEQLREARESGKARNAEAWPRDHMVDIGRGNVQAGRRKGK